MAMFVYAYALSVLALLAAAASASAAAEDKYTTKYDGVNLDEIIKNDRLFNSYFNCIMGRGKCTPDGEELKENIPEALETNCSKCSAAQKSGAQQMIKYVFEKKQPQYKELEAKFDPQGKYRKKYENQLRKT